MQRAQAPRSNRPSSSPAATPANALRAPEAFARTATNTCMKSKAIWMQSCLLHSARGSSDRGANSSSAGAGTIFATGILRGASFQTRIGARPGSRTGSLFIQPPGIPGSAGFSRTQVFSKSTSLGTSLATCTFQSEVGLETGGQGRAGGRTAQMTTRGLSDGHAGHLSRDDLSSTRRRSLGRKLSFSAHDFFGYLLRACTHNPTLANVDSKKASLGVVSGRHGDCATWSFRA